MFNYDNIGEKIKGLAKCVFIVEAIAAVTGGFVILVNEEDPIGLLIIILGPIVAWILSWILYGFGQLIENSEIIAQKYTIQGQKQVSKKSKQQLQKAKKTIANASTVDEEYIDIICPSCGAELSYTKEFLQSNEITCPMCDSQISL